MVNSIFLIAKLPLSKFTLIYTHKSLAEQGFCSFDNITQRLFSSQLKQDRAIATRFDKRKINFLGGIDLAAIVIWGSG